MRSEDMLAKLVADCNLAPEVEARIMAGFAANSGLNVTREDVERRALYAERAALWADALIAELNKEKQ